MTLPMRPLAIGALLIAALAISAYFASAPATRVGGIATAARDMSSQSPRPQPAQRSQEAAAMLPAADARTLLKYRYLLETVAESGDATADLLASLQAREDAARVGADASALDSAVLSRLSPVQHGLYEALRDSDAEQRVLGDFAGGLAEQAPLSAAQRREMLFGKLRHKQHYALMLDQSGIERPGLSDEERSYAHTVLAQALRDYRDAYLEEMRAHLDAEQFRLLSDFEHTEFELELQRLQQTINAR